jgi:hypothetical protein
MNEFKRLANAISASGCDKKQTACGTYINGVFFIAVNFCDKPAGKCTRLEAASGTDYASCGSHHAEANLAKGLTDAGEKSDGIAWLLGHYWACEPCASALKSVGVTELRIKEFV